MADNAELSTTKQQLFDKYLRGELTASNGAVAVATPLTTAPINEDEGAIVTMRAEGTRAPLFFLHGTVRESVFYCHALAHQVGPDQPMYLVNPLRWRDPATAPRLSEIAARHITAIQAVRPHGPYILGGFCSGSLVAYEIAQQLVAQGETVERLVMMETWIPNYRYTTLRLINLIGLIMGRGRRQAPLHLFMRIRHLYHFFGASRSLKLGDLRYLQSLDPRLLLFFPPTDVLRQDYYSFITWTTTFYRYKPLAAPIALIWCRDEPELRELWQRKLGKLTKGAPVFLTPGTHNTMRKEYATEFGECLARALSAH